MEQPEYAVARVRAARARLEQFRIVSAEMRRTAQELRDTVHTVLANSRRLREEAVELRLLTVPGAGRGARIKSPDHHASTCETKR